MGILSGIIPGAAGLGGVVSGGSYSTPSNASGVGLMTNASATGGVAPAGFLGGVYSSTSTAVGSALQGKLSLGLLELMVLGLVGLYIWTHDIQGGG